MSDFLERSVPSLDRVPVALRGYYDPAPDGGFLLRVRGALPSQPAAPAPAQPPASPAPARDRYSPTDTPGDTLRESVVRDAIAKIRPRPEHREDVAAYLRDRLRIDHDEQRRPVLAYLEEPGTRAGDHTIGAQRMMSHVRPGEWVASPDEWLSRVATGLRDEWLVGEPQPAPVIVQEAPRSPDVIRLRPGYTQREFERAHALAALHGASVEFPAEEAAPEPSYRGGRDVPWVAGGTQESFERAMRTAAAQGGHVDFIAEEN